MVEVSKFEGYELSIEQVSCYDSEPLEKNIITTEVDLKKIKKKLDSPHLTDCEINELAKIAFNLNRPIQRALTKIANNSLSFSVKTDGVYLYINLKQFLGEGSFKKTYLSLRYNLAKGKLKEIIIQKVKNKESLQITQHCIQQTLREIKVQSQLSHPNIVKIFYYHLDTIKNKLHIYAEKCDYSLQDYIGMNFLNTKGKINLFIDYTDALIELHLNNLVHNDIKPDNLFIKDERGKISDFGFCKQANSPYRGFKKIYAPEQKDALNHDRDPIGTFQTDTYQFGLTLWHAFHPRPRPEFLSTNFTYPNELFTDWPQDTASLALQKLITLSLHEDPMRRPTMRVIKLSLLAINALYA